jgi:hypothetical protein
MVFWSKERGKKQPSSCCASQSGLTSFMAKNRTGSRSWWGGYCVSSRGTFLCNPNAIGTAFNFIEHGCDHTPVRFYPWRWQTWHRKDSPTTASMVFAMQLADNVRTVWTKRRTMTLVRSITPVHCCLWAVSLLFCRSLPSLLLEVPYSSTFIPCMVDMGGVISLVVSTTGDDDDDDTRRLLRRIWNRFRVYSFTQKLLLENT